MKKYFRGVIAIVSLLLYQACVSKHCRYVKEEEMKKNGQPQEVPQLQVKTSSADRVRVYKFDGSLQCGLGQSKSLNETKNELSAIHVYESWKRHDGIMRIQLCGSPTGQSNVYEIDRKDLEYAVKAGFKEWTLD